MIVNTFKDLIEKYPTWSDMQLYIESEEGGHFRVVDKNEEFCMIRYEKGLSNMSLPHSKWFRSVVWNTRLHRPVCIGPPKSSTDFSFNSKMICQELLDGFMINCFKDKTLHITSRSKLDATGTFYSQKSFRDLFIEASENIDIKCPEPGEISVFYSFLVQHKDHRIVKKCDNGVFVIHRGVVHEDGTVIIEDNPLSQLENIMYEPTNEWIQNKMITNDWQFQGVVFKDDLGNRWKFRSDKYNAVKSLRGNSSNIRDRFAQLFTQNLLFRYLEYYPEEMNPMIEHVMFVNNIIKTLYDHYVTMRIKKIVIDIDKMFLPHLYNIHGIYLNQLRPIGKKITMHDISMYLQKQPWQRVSFLINKVVGIE